MPIVSLPISCVCIAGRSWLPREPKKPGQLKIHRKGTSLLLRFVKLKPAPEENAMDVDATNGAVDYPPTINIQNEVVRFQYSHNDDTPWFILLDIVTARSSKDMIPFRTGTERLGTTTFACIVGISSSTPEERRKILVHIGTCLTLNASSSLKAGVANDLYQQALQRQTEAPSILNFAVPTSVGLDHMCQIHPEQMNLRNARHTTASHHDIPMTVHQPVIQGVQYTDDANITDISPPHPHHHWNVFPILVAEEWSLLIIIQYFHMPSEARQFDSEGFIILPASCAESISRSAAEHLMETYTSPVSQNNGPARNELHFPINALSPPVATEGWQSGDHVLHYFTQILENLASCAARLREPTSAEELLLMWDSTSLDYVRPMIASSIIVYT
ncbi:hypothetical protein FIBSPDRAFT_884854 [Athelia psychrophila]|uniref:Uncharacterized protein n=1 Tax=Athelia psychrophila TaxID=1759441 RepID=A0A166SGC3_9AGAM|nr:hypothetical protein FIBSPDRAFT_884854 [Fibularhizoctonia sp. CBS 109695]